MMSLFCWVPLLMLVGCAVSISLEGPLQSSACSMICNPGAETEGERERRETNSHRNSLYLKGFCNLRSGSDHDQARYLLSYCLKLCGNELSDNSEVNCLILRSFFESQLGCFCSALKPLSPNTSNIKENWKILQLVNEMAQHLVSEMFILPIEQIVICEIYEELFKKDDMLEGRINDTCRARHDGSGEQNSQESDTSETNQDIADMEKSDSPTAGFLQKLKEDSERNIINYCRNVCLSKADLNLCDCDDTSMDTSHTMDVEADMDRVMHEEWNDIDLDELLNLRDF